MPYVSNRWLGGLLTNWRTITDRIAHLHELRRLKSEGQLELLPAKERIGLLAELEKLESNLGGVADMRRQPDAVFIVDLRKEQLAVREARRLGVPVIALVDTNCDPDEADYVIPGNDDAIRSCSLIVKAIADGVAAGQSKVTPKEMAASGNGAGAPETSEAEVEEPAETPAADLPTAESQPSEPQEGEKPTAEPQPSEPQEGEKPTAEPQPSEPREKESHEQDDSAAQVKELRDATGAPMMDAKRALQETDGDLDAARTCCASAAWPRLQAGRATTEGMVGYRIADGYGTIVGLGCETEPVSKNEEFQAFAKRLFEAVHAGGPDAVASLEQDRVDTAAKLGENIVVVGAERYEAGEGEVLNAYAHPPANKIGVLVKLAGGTEELARQLAMHISFASPEWTTKRTCPPRSSRRRSRSTSTRTSSRTSPSRPRRRSWRACSRSASSPRSPAARSPSSRGSTTRRRP